MKHPIAVVPLRAILIAIGIHTLWGGIAVSVKYSLLVFPPLWTSFFRFSIGVLCITAWALLHRIRIRPNREEWPALLALGLLFTVQIGTMNTGINFSSGSIASILIATNPLFAAFFAHLFIPGDRLTGVKLIGLTIAFCGTGIVLLQGSSLTSLQLFNVGNWILLFSAALLGARLAFSARLLRQIDAVRVLIWQMLVSLPLFALGGWWQEDIAWEALSWQPIAGILYQGVVIAGLGFMVTSYLMKNYRPSIMMSFNFVAPVSGVLLSIMLLGDPMTWHLLLGLLTVAAGLWVITRQ
ncbi:MAG: DMT family transporter [Gammaproteobacteria bacterium]